MQKSKLTVFFDDPFWVGVYEKILDGRLEVCKITFGAMPKDCEVYEFLLKNWGRLRFSPAVKADNTPASSNINPKRMQRAIKRQLEGQGVGTKAQQALKLQQIAGNEARKKQSRLKRQQEKERRFELKQEKKKQKQKGH